MERDFLTGLAGNPVFFERNRVSRVYRGGRLFAGFFGDRPEDGYSPEEWVASDVKAVTENGESEGVSIVEGTDVPFDVLIRERRDCMVGKRGDLGVLVKLLDSAVRLPLQAHPDKAFSKEHFHADYGKVESWVILDTREDAAVFIGFKDRISQEDLISAIRRSETDKDAMESLLQRVPVARGDVFLIPARLVHAIGYGCLILEVQEPTDFTIQPEAWCGEHHLSAFEKYAGLDESTALECFDYGQYGKAALLRSKKSPRVYAKSEGWSSELLISPEDTPCFSVFRHRVHRGELPLENAPGIIIVTDGAAVIQKEGYERPLHKGDYFFLPHAIKGECKIVTDSHVELVECLPSGIAPGTNHEKARANP